MIHTSLKFDKIEIHRGFFFVLTSKDGNELTFHPFEAARRFYWGPYKHNGWFVLDLFIGDLS